MDPTLILASPVNEFLEAPNSGWVIFAATVVVCTALSTVKSVVRNVARERTRREIAAFIAEGSMSPEQGERLLKSGERDHA